MITMQQKIFDYLVNFIDKDSIEPGEKMPAESELCTMFNTSRSTVRKAYDELVHTGYVIRKPGLGSFVKERACPTPPLSIGVIVPEMNVFEESSDPISGHLKFDIFNGILRCAHEINARINMIPALENWTPNQKMDGYLLLYYDENILKQLRELAVPCVGTLLGGIADGVSAITTNLHKSFISCFEYLVGEGHKNIGLIDNTKSAAYPAYREVMSKYSLPHDKSHVEVFDQNIVNSGKDAFIKLIQKNNYLDSVFFRTDITAIAALDYCKKRGIKIPEELSIMGFDNNLSAGADTYNLTTFDTFREIRGYRALKRLQQLIIDPSLPTKVETIDGEVIERATVLKNQKVTSAEI